MVFLVPVKLTTLCLSAVGFIKLLFGMQVRGYTSPQDFINDRYGTLRLRLLCAVCGVIPMISVLVCIPLPRLEVWVDGNIAQVLCHSDIRFNCVDVFEVKASELPCLNIWLGL